MRPVFRTTGRFVEKPRAKGMLSRSGTSFNPLSLGAPAAWYRRGIGFTDAGAGACSAWADQSGNGRNLVQGTAANRPTIQSDGSLIFDGADDSLQALFTLNQPYSVYMVVRQLAWTANRYLLDGGTGNATIIQDDLGVSPDLEIFAGTRLRPLSGPAIGTTAVVTAVFNGASSSLSLNNGTPITGAAGANNPGGVTVGGALSLGSLCSNIRVWEVMIRNGADDAATQTAIFNYLRARI